MAQPDMTELIAALTKASKETPTKETKKEKGTIFTAKNITLLILIIAFGFGIYGSFEKAFFVMEDYTKFIETFTWFFAPLVVSIGAGSATKTLGELRKPKPTEEVKK